MKKVLPAILVIALAFTFAAALTACTNEHGLSNGTYYYEKTASTLDKDAEIRIKGKKAYIDFTIGTLVYEGTYDIELRDEGVFFCDSKKGSTAEFRVKKHSDETIEIFIGMGITKFSKE